jgi:hypothetical protein
MFSFDPFYVLIEKASLGLGIVVIFDIVWTFYITLYQAFKE